ncbi:hypothetical protein B0H13DRAFT_2278313 [Mycena leptocephala]|nr:hypothetical protein B0H13DRAFT_2278313 [Mycena leptocephala]
MSFARRGPPQFQALISGPRMRNGDASGSDGVPLQPVAAGTSPRVLDLNRPVLLVHAEPERRQHEPVPCRALRRVGERPAWLICFPPFPVLLPLCVNALMLRDVTPLSFTAQTVHCMQSTAAGAIRILVDALPARDALPRGPRTPRHPIVRLRRRIGTPRQPPLAIAKPRGLRPRGVDVRVRPRGCDSDRRRAVCCALCGRRCKGLAQAGSGERGGEASEAVRDERVPMGGRCAPRMGECAWEDRRGAERCVTEDRNARGWNTGQPTLPASASYRARRSLAHTFPLLNRARGSLRQGASANGSCGERSSGWGGGPGVGEAVTWVLGESLRAVVHLKEDNDATRFGFGGLAGERWRAGVGGGGRPYVEMHHWGRRTGDEDEDALMEVRDVSRLTARCDERGTMELVRGAGVVTGARCRFTGQESSHPHPQCQCGVPGSQAAAAYGRMSVFVYRASAYAVGSAGGPHDD